MSIKADKWIRRMAEQGRGLIASELLPAIRQLLEEVSPCLL